MKSEKKKRIGMLLAYCMFILLGVTSVSVTSKAAETADGYVYYVDEESGYAKIKGYTGSDTELVIPEEVDGHKVTEIGYNAFSGCSSLTSITIPEGVTSIGDYAFSGCSSLTSITIPEGVTEIGYDAFSGCSSLTSITIPEGVTSIKSSTFSDCSSLTSVTIPEGVTEIRDNAFYGCSSLASITIPKSVTSIGESAFEDTAWLKEQKEKSQIIIINNILIDGTNAKGNIVIPEEVTSIGSDAFRGCSGLTSITIPARVTSIGTDAFARCENLSEIIVAEENEVYYSEGNCIVTKEGELVLGCSVSKIPEDVTSIGRSAFYGCSGLTSITIPAKVTSIGYYAFAYCDNLSEIIVAEENEVYYSAGNCIVTKEGELVLGCNKSEIPEEVTSIGSDAFRGCSGLTSVTIPNGVTNIGTWAFYGCSGLTSITISDGVTNIGSWAFQDCSSLTSITISKGVTIRNNPFDGCNKDMIVYTVPDSDAEKWAIEGGYNVEIIGEEAVVDGNTYRYCTLNEATIEIIDYTGNATEVKVPNSINGKKVTIIGKSAFQGCEATTINISEGITHIKSRAFEGCSNLTCIEFPASVINIMDGVLADNPKLDTITVAEGNENYYSNGNCLISKEGNLIAGCKSSEIPIGVKRIGNYAFSGCKNLRSSITIPSGVISIGDYAFFNCDNLSDITIPASVERIGKGKLGYNYYDEDSHVSTTIHALNGSYAAEWAKKNDYTLVNLSQTYKEDNVTYEYEVSDDGNIQIDACFSENEEIEIPTTIDGKTVTSIGRRAFTECEYYLTSISIPDSVTSIGDYAFSECTALSEVSLSSQSNLTSIGDYAFAVCDNIETITIPNGVTSIGEGAFSDCESLTSIVIPNGVTNIKKNTFNSCCSLESVSLPPSMTNIGEAAFSGCDMLQNITLPEGLKTIAKDTFSCCAGLTGITIPSTVTSIGENAFGGCSGLTNIMIPASVTNINKAAFDGCKGLTGVEVAEENEVYYSEQNCIIRKDNAELVLGCKNSIIPNNVKSIGACAFSGCMDLRSITIPNGVISIGDCAFSNCKGLTSITIPDSVVNFGEYAIDGNEDDFVIYASADSAAAKWAKENGFDVSSPKDDDPSGGNDNPGTDNPSGGNDNPGTGNPSGGNDNPGTNNPSGGNTGNGTTTDTTTPGGTTPVAPQPAAPAANTVEEKKPAAVGTVLKGAVANANVTVTSDRAENPTVEYTAVTNKKAKTVTIPDSVTVDGITYKVTSVSEKAFAGCKKATKITIGANVTSIGKNAFKNCKTVKTITIKSTKLAKNAFAKAGVKKLSKKVTIKVPKSCKKDYKKQLKKAGFKGKIK